MDRIKSDFFRTTLLNERRLGCRQSLTFLDLPFPVDHTAHGPDDLSVLAPGKKTLVFVEGAMLERLLPGLEQLSNGSALAFDWPTGGAGEGPGRLDLLLSRYGFRLYEQRDFYDTLLWYQQMGSRMPYGPHRRSLCLAVRR